MKSGIIIVNYNGKKMLEECLNSCLSSLHLLNCSSYEIIVVDNGSIDGSQAFVHKNFPDVKLIEVGYNSGFAYANNIGIEEAIKNGAEGVFLINNDIILDQLFFKNALSVYNCKEKVEMIAFKVLLYNEKNKIDGTGIIITPDGIGKNKNLGEDEKKRDNIEEVFCPYGAAAFYSVELLLDVKENNQFLDNHFKFYLEDLDLGWRARLRGWKCLYNPGAVAFHLKNATAGQYSEFLAYYTNRNIFYNIIKNYPVCFMIKALFLSLLRYPLLIVGFMFNIGAGYKIREKIGHGKMIKVAMKSFFDAAKNTGSMLAKRKIIQRNRKVDNKEIKRWFKELGLSFFESIYR
jgi:GT2 family glycosyltransferase